MRCFRYRHSFQFYCSGLTPIVFVIVGLIMAPAHRFWVAMTLTIINAVFCAVIVMMAISNPGRRVPVWWLIICSSLGIIATIGLCSKVAKENSN